MSIVGVSSYFLWTQKGQTVLPLVRGSGFVLAFTHRSTFYHHHILTAAHVACPVRYRKLYGDSVGLRAIGERHISTRLLHPESSAPHRIIASVSLEPQQNFLPHVDVVTLRCTSAAQLAETNVRSLEVDKQPVGFGTPLLFCGVRAIEERANPNDDGLLLQPFCMRGTCKAALVSLQYGTVLLASLDCVVDDDAAATTTGDKTTNTPTTMPSTSSVHDETVSIKATVEPHNKDQCGSTGVTCDHPLPLSVCGGAVLRADSGKCVGVIVSRVVRGTPPRDVEVKNLYENPFLDISQRTDLHKHCPLDVAFVPIAEFYNALRNTEM